MLYRTHASKEDQYFVRSIGRIKLFAGAVEDETCNSLICFTEKYGLYSYLTGADVPFNWWLEKWILNFFILLLLESRDRFGTNEVTILLAQFRCKVDVISFKIP